MWEPFALFRHLNFMLWVTFVVRLKGYFDKCWWRLRLGEPVQFLVGLFGPVALLSISVKRLSQTW